MDGVAFGSVAVVCAVRCAVMSTSNALIIRETGIVTRDMDGFCCWLNGCVSTGLTGKRGLGVPGMMTLQRGL